LRVENAHNVARDTEAPFLDLVRVNLDIERPARIGGGHRHLVIGAVYTDKGPAAVDDAATRGHTDLTEPRPPGGALVAGTWTANKRCVGGAELMNDTRTRELYSSPNGDRWHLCKDASGRVFVLHQANIPSGGQISQIELGHFLTRGYGPEQQALFQMIGTLIGALRVNF
jgi:hypothetical protein